MNSAKRNVWIDGSYTSIALEPEFLQALREFAVMRSCSVSGLIRAIATNKKPSTSLASAIRVFLLEYYRNQKRR